MSFNIHTFKKVIAGKFALLMMFFLAQAVSAMADTKLYMEDFSIAAGETKEVALILDNDQDATVLEVHIDLPAGLQYVDESVSKTDRVKGRGAEVQASTQTGQLVIVVTDATIAAGKGAVITFELTRTGLIDGEYEIPITNIVVSDADAKQLNTVEETTVKVEAVGLKDCFFTAAESLEVVEGNEYQIDVNLTNYGVNNLSAFQGILTLPEGLELVPGEEGKFIYTDRIPAKAEFKFQEEEGYITFVLSSSQNYMITGEEGVFFSFKVKATEDLAENTEILLSDLRVAATTGQSAAAPDVKISVYNASILAAAKQALADEIAAATTLLGEADQTVEPGLSLSEAIAAAQIILEDEESTTEVVNAAVETLKAAEEEFTKGAYNEGVIYSWESPEGTPIEMGGTIAYVNGDGDRLNYLNSGYYTICLNGKKANLNDEVASASAGHMVITLDEAVAEGDNIAITGYITKNSSSKSSAWIVFENGATAESAVFGDESNIYTAEGVEATGAINTKDVVVSAEAAGSKTITLTRGQTGTNLFITKLQIKKANVVTGINFVKAAIEDGAVYNLNGQKVIKAQKGLYIINGKKVVIK